MLNKCSGELFIIRMWNMKQIAVIENNKSIEKKNIAT